jgi:hypothetical protein
MSIYVIIAAGFLCWGLVMAVLLFKVIFNKRFIGIRVIDGTYYHFESPAKEVMRDGKKKWILLWRRMLPEHKGMMPAPPAKARRITAKGRWVAEGFVNDRDEVHFVEANEVHRDLRVYITGEEKHEYTHQLELAAQQRGQSVMMGVVNNIGVLALVIVIFGFLIFGTDLMTQYNEITAAHHNRMEASHDGIVDLARELKAATRGVNGKQEIEDKDPATAPEGVPS